MELGIIRPGECHERGVLELRLLGDFQLSHGDAPLVLSPRAEHLLAFLALRNGVTRTAVLAHLWPDLDEVQGRGCLRSTLWRLPRPDGRPLVATSGDKLCLTAFVQVDITRLRHRLDRWVSGQTPPVPIGELSLDLLPAWYDDWLMLDRERQRQVRLHALERMSAWYVDMDRVDFAIEAALEAIAGDPLRESAHRCLIRAHLAEGNVSEAHRQVDAYRALLADAGIPVQLSVRMHELLPGPTWAGGTVSPRW
jgi:DNA-binding SARP family transcriptional activator